MKPFPSPLSHSRRARGGSTLLLALWALLLLSAIVFAWAKWIDREIESLRDENFAAEARALARSGVAVALHPNVSKFSPVLRASFDAQHSYEVTIESEGGKLNLNYLLLREDPGRLDLLKQYLTLRGLKLEERARLVDCMLDWIDPDNTRHLNGAEEEADYKPSNRPFNTLDEVPLVRGSAPLLAYANWRNDFTLYGNGLLDMESASQELIGLIPGIGEMRAEQFVRYRRGPDRLDGTEDDAVFTNLDDLLSHLGISRQQYETMRGCIGFREPTVRIRSVGIAGNVRRQIDVVARKVAGSPSQILLWTEK